MQYMIFLIMGTILYYRALWHFSCVIEILCQLISNSQSLENIFHSEFDNFRYSYKYRHADFSLCNWLISCSIVLSKFICVAYDTISFFKGWIISHCMCYCAFLIHVSVNGYLGCFYNLMTLISVAMTIDILISIWNPYFNSFGDLESKIDRIYGSSIFFFFWEIIVLFFIRIIPFCIST